MCTNNLFQWNQPLWKRYNSRSSLWKVKLQIIFCFKWARWMHNLPQRNSFVVLILLPRARSSRAAAAGAAWLSISNRRKFWFQRKIWREKKKKGKGKKGSVVPPAEQSDGERPAGLLRRVRGLGGLGLGQSEREGRPARGAGRVPRAELCPAGLGRGTPRSPPLPAPRRAALGVAACVGQSPARAGLTAPTSSREEFLSPIKGVVYKRESGRYPCTAGSVPAPPRSPRVGSRRSLGALGALCLGSSLFTN